jgi:osmotically-inducible protein OsmY
MKRKRVILTSLLAGTLLGGAAWAADPADDTDPARPHDYPADNTGRNMRDRDDRAVTPTDQSESPADRKVTQKIRSAVVEDESLSTSAHNVKIITVDGVVTLRGPVKSERERNVIAAKAKSVAGVKQVQNKLEIARE